MAEAEDAADARAAVPASRVVYVDNAARVLHLISRPLHVRQTGVPELPRWLDH